MYLDADAKTDSSLVHRAGYAIWVMLAAICLEHAVQEHSSDGAALDQHVRVGTCLTLSAICIAGCVLVHAKRLTYPVALRYTYAAFAVVIWVANTVLMMAAMARHRFHVA